MINRTMANIDVKLGIKHILDRVEQAYLKRSPVRRDLSFNQLMHVFLFIVNFLFFFTLGHSNSKTIIGGRE